MDLLKDSIDYFIFAVLGLMGFITVWLTIERLMFLKKVKIKRSGISVVIIVNL